MTEELKILLLEDIMDEADLMERVMRKDKMKFTLKRVDTREEYVEALEQFNPDVVLSDHALPQFNSIQALALCRNHSASVPFILVTGAVSEEFAVNCLKQGADDYVLKANLSRLPNAIVNALNYRKTEEKKKVAEEELRIQNEQLRKSNKELLKINSELDNFVYNVSHNIRGPLSSVTGLINIAALEDIERDKYFASYFDMMRQSVQKLDNTLQEILDYSHNARGEMSRQEISIVSLFYEQLEKLKYLDQHQPTPIEIHIKGDAVVKTDRYRLGIVFNSLLSNAIKYSDVKKDKRIISLVVTVGNDVVISITDNGIGIKSQYMTKIFNMFFRASEQSDGSGLGLYIVREAIEKLKGSITVQSIEGEGTTFKITLPNLDFD